MSLRQSLGMGPSGSPKPPTLETASTGEEARKAILLYLKKHRKWYHRWSRFYSIAWHNATLLVVVLGALTSILTAIKPQPVPTEVLIALPALSSLLAAILIQFKLKESCRVRERGRIATEELICEALVIPTQDKEKALKRAVEIRERAHQLERDQLAEFLAEAPSPPGAAKPKSQPTAPSPSSQGAARIPD